MCIRDSSSRIRVMTRPHKKGRVGRILVEFGLKTERSNPSFRLDSNATQTRILTRTQIRSGTQANKKKTCRVELETGIRLETRESNSNSFHPYIISRQIQL